MNRFLKPVLLFLVVVALLAALLEYLNRAVLPVRAREWAQETASRALGRPVTVGRVKLHLWHGFVIERLAVADAEGFGPEPFLEVEKISGGVLLLPLLKHRELIVPTLHIVGPRLRLSQGADERWNFEELLVRTMAPSRGRARLRWIIPRVVLSDGQIRWHLVRGESMLDGELKNVGADLHLSLPARIEARLEGLCHLWTEADPGAPIELSVDGAYDLVKHTLSARGRLSGPLPFTLPVLPPGARDAIRELDGTAAVDWQLEGGLRGPLRLQGWLELEKTRCLVKQPIRQGWEGEPPEELRVEGNLQAKVDADLASWRSRNPWDSLRAVVQLEKVSVGPLPLIQELRDLTGEVTVGPEGIRTEALTGTLPMGTPILFSGSLANDDQRSIGLRAVSQFPLAQLPPIPGGMERLLLRDKLSGQANLEAVASGTLRPTLSLRPIVTLSIQDAKAELPGGHFLEQASGTLRWQRDLLTVTEAKGLFLKRPFQIEGTVVGLAQPEVDARLSWGELTLETQMIVSGKSVHLNTLTGRLGNGSFRVLGEVNWPQGNLYAEGTLPVEKAVEFLQDPAGKGWQEVPEGEVSFRCLIEGDLSRPSQSALDLKVSSPSLTVRQIPLKQLAVDLRREKQRWTLSSGQFRFAEGQAGFSGTLDEARPEKPWEGSARLQGMQLAAMGRILQWKTPTLSGQLSGEWTGQGEALRPEAIRGSGKARIDGAQILEMPLLGGFAEFLGMPSLRKIVFQQAQGSFAVGNGRIRSEDLQLRSPQATLTVIGEGGFAQGVNSPVDWRVIPTLSADLIPEESRSRIGRVIAKGTSYLIGEYRVTGTWKEPKRKFNPKPVTQILNEQLFNLQDLLEEIL